MNFLSRLSAIIFVICTFTQGCTTTERSRREAAILEAKVDAYSRQQKARIDRLNQEYRQTFNGMMGELSQLTEEELEQRQTLDSQEIADQILERWMSDTLPSKITTLFAQRRDVQRSRIAEAERAIAEARNQYSSAYEELQLESNKLKKSQENLHSLSKKSDADLESLVKLASKISEIYQKKEDKRRAAASNKD